MASIINLAVNGISTGMLIFLLAVGLSLIFGLMDVLNFAHGGLFVWGAFFGIWAYEYTHSFWLGIVGAILVGILLGWAMERFIVKPVYGNPVQQILITLGAMLVLSEMLKVVWGPNPIEAKTPGWLDGSWGTGGIILIKYRIFIVVVGAIVFAAVMYVMKRTKLGLIVRAGVMNKEMVQALGIDVNKVFMVTFMCGSALAAFSGVLLGPYSGVINADMGTQYNILAFIVVIVGGAGSIAGSLFASLLVGLLGAFTAYYAPDFSLAVNMILMAIVLLFRPTGLFRAGEGQ